MRQKWLLVGVLLVAAVLRIWRLAEVPVSLFGDELDVGYHAYSILKTGRDYQGNFLPLHFHSLAEWRAPLYLYSVVPTISIFGISEWGVRLPAAIFGVASVWAMYLAAKTLSKNNNVGLVAAFVLAISPWHIQYSRAGFEVTLMLFLLLIGVYLFFKGLKSGKWLWVAAVSFSLMPWTYSTAKLFTPLLLAFLVLVWWRELIGLHRKYLIYAVSALVIVGTPIAYSSLAGGGAERFSYIGVFTDPSVESEVGTAREKAARVRGEMGEDLAPSFLDRVLYNKFNIWFGKIFDNYYQALSFDFLFNTGDPNLRHSIDGIGQFYKVEAIALVLGIVLFFRSKASWKIKLFVVFWIVAGVLPASLTRDGGKHATRLFLILSPLVFLISHGIVHGVGLVPKKFRVSSLLVYVGILFVSFLFYQNNFWNVNPWSSERWWHAGWEEAIKSAKEIEGNYDSVVISMRDEPAWIFFAGHYQYPPEVWQDNFPIGNDVELPGFGNVSHIGKFYFGTPQADGVYSYGQVVAPNVLYLASQKEVNVNLIMEPERTPPDLVLIKSIAYPSGEPAFYLFTGVSGDE